MLRKILCYIILTILVTTFLSSTVSVKAQKDIVVPAGYLTIIINSNGTITPANAPIIQNGDTYTLTDNVYVNRSGIEIQRNNTIFDGANHILQGKYTGEPDYGFGLIVQLPRLNNITVKNLVIDHFERIGISIWNNASNLTFYNNTIMNCGEAILAHATNCTFIENTIIGLSGLNDLTNSIFYHNNYYSGPAIIFMATPTDLSNVWDNGYPLGGNYWSNYTGIDVFCGPYQNITGSDGIGDTPYTLIGFPSNGLNVTDRYPLMKPYSKDSPMIPELSTLALIIVLVATSSIIIVTRKKISKGSSARV